MGSPAVHAELVQDLRACPAGVVRAIRAELHGLLVKARRDLQHLADDRQPLGGVRVEERGR